jgi:hypothetical protein
MWTGAAGGATRPSEQTGPAPTCPAGSTPNQPGSRNEARPVIEGNAAAMDPAAHKLVVVNDEGSTWTFNVCTNRWRTAAPLRYPGVERRLRAVYDAASDRVLAYSDGAFATYDARKNSWTRFGPAKAAVRKSNGPEYVFYDAGSDRVIVYTTAKAAVWSYSPSAKAWQKLDDGLPALRPRNFVDIPVVTFDPVRRQLVALRLNARATWTFGLTSFTWVRHPGPTPALSVGWVPSGGEVAFDVTADRAVAFGDGRLYLYDPSAEAWTRVPVATGPRLHRPGPTGSLARMGHTLVYDPVNARTVLLGGVQRHRTQSGDPDKVWPPATDVLAYTAATNAWTTLVRPKD